MLFLNGSRSVGVGIALAVAAAAEAAGAQQPAGAATHADTLHGVVVADPYRWLEDVASPRARAWIRAQDGAARRRLAAMPGRAGAQTLVSAAAAAGIDAYAAPVKEGGRYFVTRSPAVGPQREITLLVRDSATGATSVLLDPAELRRAGRPARRAIPAPTGELVAYGVSADDTEWEMVLVRRVSTGKDLADSVTGLFRYSGLSWARDGRVGFYYTRFAEPAGNARDARPAGSGEVYYHRVGDPQSADRLVFAPRDSTPVISTPQVTDDGRYLVITVRRGTARASGIYVQALRGQGGPEQRPAPRLLVDGDGANYVFLGNDGPVFWIATDNGAPRGRVIAVDAARPMREHWRVLVPEGPDAIDNWSFGAALGGHLLVLYRRDAVLVGRMFTRDGQLRYELEIPNLGSVWTGVVGKTTASEALFTVQGVADPGTVYRLDVRTGGTTPFLRPDLPYDPTQLITEQRFYRGRDGARIPMYVVRRRDVPLDGTAPLWVYGYGAQRWTAGPWFQPPIAAWLRDGGVWALPNTRGGAEYGERWYQAGTRRNKQTAIDDYVAAVEWLIANKYTSAGRVVAHTSSAGGVLVAAAVVQRPELFGAAVMEYPVLDMLRYEHFLAGNRWTEDYGTVKDSADFAAMLAYAPIQNLRPGSCYPATLVTPGERDQTAAPPHAYKFVAALQAAQGCPDRPVLLRVSWGAGHTAGATVADAIENWVDQLAFVREALDDSGSRREAGRVRRVGYGGSEDRQGSATLRPAPPDPQLALPALRSIRPDLRRLDGAAHGDRAARRRHAEHHGVPGLLAEYLEEPELDEVRVALDHLRGIGEAPQRRRFAARSLERREALLPCLHDLREDLLEIAGQRQVLDVGGLQLDAGRAHGRGRELHHSCADAGAALEQFLHRAPGDHRPEGELEACVERRLVALDLVHGLRRVHDPVARGEAQLERDAVGAQHLLAGHGDDAGAYVHATDGRLTGEHPVAARPHHAAEAAVGVLQAPLELVDGDAREVGANEKDHDQRREENEDRRRRHAEGTRGGVPRLGAPG